MTRVLQTTEQKVTKTIQLGEFDGKPLMVEQVYILRPNGSFDFFTSEDTVLTFDPVELGITVPIEFYKEDSKNVYVYRHSWQTYYVEMVLDFDAYPDKCKIILQGHLQSGGSLKLPLKSSQYFMDIVNLRMGAESEGSRALFDWSDCPDYVTIDAETNCVVFTVPADFVIDPYTVATYSVTDYGFLGQEPQRATFYGNNYWYVLPNNGSYTRYHSSSDGSTWSAGANIAASNRGYKDSICMLRAGGNVAWHVTAGSSNAGTPWFRTLTLSAGAITVGTARAVPQTANTYESHPSLCEGSDGYPWCFYLTTNGGSGNYCLVQAVKATATDGSTWPASPTQVNTGNTTACGKPGGTAFANNQIFLCYSNNTTTLQYVYFNGSSWSSPATLSTACATEDMYSLVSNGNNLGYLAYKEGSGTSWTVKVRKLTVSGTTLTVGDAEDVVQNQNNGHLTCAMNLANDDFVVFYSVFLQYIDGRIRHPDDTWSALFNPGVDEGGNVNLRNVTASQYANESRQIGIGYVTGTATPYNIRHIIWTFPEWSSASMYTPSGGVAYNGLFY